MALDICYIGAQDLGGGLGVSEIKYMHVLICIVCIFSFFFRRLSSRLLCVCGLFETYKEGKHDTVNFVCVILFCKRNYIIAFSGITLD